jgi:Dolichyl-phosphate-mannose-protein mannosyltransferase
MAVHLERPHLESREPPRETPAASRRSLWNWATPQVVFFGGVCAVAVAAGIFLRLWLLENSPTNSDEATAGIIAHQILHGRNYAFYWGQHYGGLESYVVAANFWLFGQSPLVLNVTPTLLAVAASVLVWRIGLRLFPPPAAVFAAVLSWIWAESSLWNSTKEYGFHEVGLVLGLVMVLESVRIVRDARQRGRDRILDWTVLGAAGGLGFWASPEIIYFAIPCAVTTGLALRGCPPRRILARLASASIAAAIGALPWLWSTSSSHSAGIPSSPVSYASRLSTFFTHVLPMVLGVRIEGAGLWEGRPAVGITFCVVLTVLVTAAAAVVALKVPDARVVVLVLALFPFLYAAFPTAWFWNDGRYAIGLTPILSLVVAGGIWQTLRIGSAVYVASVVLIAALASTLIAFNVGTAAISMPSKLASFAANPNPAVTSLASQLEHLGVSRAFAGYWVANDLTFLSQSRITAITPGGNRNPPGSRNDGPKPVAWVFVPAQSVPTVLSQLGSATGIQPGTITESSFIGWLTSKHIAYQRVTVSGFDVIVPTKNVTSILFAG